MNWESNPFYFYLWRCVYSAASPGAEPPGVLSTCWEFFVLFLYCKHYFTTNLLFFFFITQRLIKFVQLSLSRSTRQFLTRSYWLFSDWFSSRSRLPRVCGFIFTMALNPNYESIGKAFTEQYYNMFDNQVTRYSYRCCGTTAAPNQCSESVFGMLMRIQFLKITTLKSVELLNNFCLTYEWQLLLRLGGKNDPVPMQSRDFFNFMGAEDLSQIKYSPMRNC